MQKLVTHMALDMNTRETEHNHIDVEALCTHLFSCPAPGISSSAVSRWQQTALPKEGPPYRLKPQHVLRIKISQLSDLKPEKPDVRNAH